MHPYSHSNAKRYFAAIPSTHPPISENAKRWTHKVYQKYKPFNDQKAVLEMFCFLFLEDHFFSLYQHENDTV